MLIRPGFTLSPLEWSDRGEMHRLLNETNAFHQCMGSVPFPYPLEILDQWLRVAIDQALPESSRVSWAIRNSENRLVGEISLIDCTRGEQAEIGYWVARSYWGQGLATDAARRVCIFGFQSLELRRIHAKVFARNPSSANVLRKLGFRHEGTLRCGYFLDGEALDDELYGLLREDFSDA